MDGQSGCLLTVSYSEKPLGAALQLKEGEETQGAASCVCQPSASAGAVRAALRHAGCCRSCCAVTGT